MGRPALTDKDHLLDVAEVLFAEKGYNGVSVREVARKAKCNVALISYHFGGKRPMYHALFLRHSKRTRDSILPLTESLPPFFRESWQNQLRELIYHCGRIIAAHRSMQRIFCREMLSGGKNAGTILKAAAQFGLYGIFFEELETLKKQKKLLPSLNLRLATIGLLGPLIYSCVAQTMLKNVYGIDSLSEAYLEDLSAHLARTFLEGNQVCAP